MRSEERIRKMFETGKLVGIPGISYYRPKGTMNKTTGDLIFQAKCILEEYHPMTVRQLYYQLVARDIIKENKLAQYKKLVNAIRDARKKGIIPWAWIEDRLRRPRTVAMWNGMGDFGDSVLRSYRLNVWTDQPVYVECWLEKDALSGIFEDILDEYGVTLNVGRGYDGWTSIKDAANRYKAMGLLGKPVKILYFGDHDPSGVDMSRSLEERLQYFKVAQKIEKIAILKEDIKKFNLPPAIAKEEDPRFESFVEEQGSKDAVELDALPAYELHDRIILALEDNMDIDALEDTRRKEANDIEKLREMFSAF